MGKDGYIISWQPTPSKKSRIQKAWLHSKNEKIFKVEINELKKKDEFSFKRWEPLYYFPKLKLSDTRVLKRLGGAGVSISAITTVN